MSDPDPETDQSARRVLVTGLGLLVLAMAVVAVVTSVRGSREQIEQPLVASAPLASSAAPSAVAPSASPTVVLAMPTPTGDPSPEPGVVAGPTTAEAASAVPETEGSATPTDADAARFASSFAPPGASQIDTVTVDLENDGIDEVVAASVAADTSRIDVARWTGDGYEVAFSGRGGSAQRLDDLQVADVNGDGLREIWVAERSGEQGASISMWGLVGSDGLAPLVADGGCADGRHTYGVVGAQVRQGQIAATCDAAPLPPELWPSDVYRWDDGRWTFVERRDGT